MFLISTSSAIVITNINIIFTFLFIINTFSILALAKEPFYIDYS